MADFHPMEYASQHPYITGGVVFGGGLLLLWWFGFFGGSSSSSSSSDATTQQNLAAAYYSAEAAQTTAGTNLQIATVNDQAQTDLASIEANSADAIASTQAGMYTTLGGQQLQLGTVQAGDALAEANANYNEMVAVDQSNNSASEFNTALGTVVAPELQLTGGTGMFNIPQIGGQLGINTQVTSPAGAYLAGYSPEEIQAAFG